MDAKSRHYPETRFGGFTHVDGTIAFYLRVRALIRPCFTVVDVGCGRGDSAADPVEARRSLHDLRPCAQQVIGIDLDPEAARNPFIDAFHLLEDSRQPWPLGAASADLIVSDWVVEHLDDPDRFFAECHRILKEGGFLCLRTTNRLGYVGLISSLTPHRLHTRVANRARGLMTEHDTHRTHYRCNTSTALRRALTRHGFDACVYGHEAEPSYLGFSSLAYRAGVLYQKLAPGCLANTLFAFAQKTKEPPRVVQLPHETAC